MARLNVDVSRRLVVVAKIFLWFLIVWMPSCTTVDDDQRQGYIFDKTRPLVPQFETIQASDGIDMREADLLAILYFEKYSGMCGGAFPVQRRGKRWRSYVLEGPSGHHGPVISIHAETGVITQKGNPDSSPPWDDLRKYVLMQEQILQQISASIRRQQTTR